MKLSHIVILFLSAISGNIGAQNINTYGFLPSVNINANLPNDWFTNFKIESRQEIFKDGFEYSYNRTDLSLVTGKKVGYRTRIAIGYQLISVRQEVSNRFIQQINHIKKYRTLMLSHRVQADQTINKNNGTEYRIRYRLSTEIPLNGHSVDPKEPYIKASNEYLNSIQGSEYDLEIRIAGYIGYFFSPKTKFEIGIDNRLDSFINDRLRNRFWLGVGLYQSF